VLGRTCLTCSTIYPQFMFPLFQEPDAKHGKYDVYRQLPNNSKDYPLCENCLPWHWRVEAARHDMEKEVKEAYTGYFS